MAIHWVRKARLGFTDIEQFPESHPGPFEREMGKQITELLRLFQGRVPDPETSARVLQLANTPSRWSAGHALFDVVRGLTLTVMNGVDRARSAQYAFEESCLQALYNAAGPLDEFDPSSLFFVAGTALILARVVGVPAREVVAVLAPAPSGTPEVSALFTTLEIPAMRVPRVRFTVRRTLVAVAFVA